MFHLILLYTQIKNSVEVTEKTLILLEKYAFFGPADRSANFSRKKLLL